MSRTPHHPITDELIDLSDPASNSDDYSELEAVLVETEDPEPPPGERGSPESGSGP
jgi:hypothetical protein